MEKSTLQLLKETKELLSDPKRWIKQKMAINSDGFTIDPCSKRAIAFCAVGAVHRTANKNAMDIICILIKYIPNNRYLRTITLSKFNDHHATTHTDIMNLFDSTITQLETEGYK